MEDIHNPQKEKLDSSSADKESVDDEQVHGADTKPQESGNIEDMVRATPENSPEPPPPDGPRDAESTSGNIEDMVRATPE
jgi:hypothetical protein